jgi:hypothetical protein
MSGNETAPTCQKYTSHNYCSKCGIEKQSAEEGSQGCPAIIYSFVSEQHSSQILRHWRRFRIPIGSTGPRLPKRRTLTLLLDRGIWRTAGSQRSFGHLGRKESTAPLITRYGQPTGEPPALPSGRHYTAYNSPTGRSIMVIRYPRLICPFINLI